jgi:hypothetical protein
MTEALRFGIAITTFNRKDMLVRLVDALRRLTVAPFDLVVCDDGSSDGTGAAMAALGVKTIGVTNRGIAWNKNRGLYYLLNVKHCDVVLLLDDDIIPVNQGWEAAWIDAAWRYGHVNYALPAFRSSQVAGAGTDPPLASMVPGVALGFSRVALAQIGYFDLRFGRYGHEHSDMSFRAVRAGFGGIRVQTGQAGITYLYVIDDGLEMLPAASSGTSEELERNNRLLSDISNDPVYRHAWPDDFTRNVFLGEIDDAGDAADQKLLRKNNFSSLEQYQTAGAAMDRNEANLAWQKPAAQSSAASGGPPAEDAAGAVNGRPCGRHQFHTAVEQDPWWQVDLGAPTTIAEIRIFNTLADGMRDRFRRFRIAVGFDVESLVDVFTAEADIEVGGIDGRAFIWRPEFSAWGRFVRITALGHTSLHLDQIEIYGPPDPARPRPMPDQELFLNFVSLGDNCELGLVQRAVGIEPRDLLRFGSNIGAEDGLIRALQDRFCRFGPLEDMAVSDTHFGEWIVNVRPYGVRFHTDRRVADIDQATVMAQESKHLTLLARRMVADLEAGEKVFVRKSNDAIPDQTMLAVFEAMRAYGSPTLLWVSADTSLVRARVDRLAPGLLRGFIPRFAPYSNAHDISVPDWRDLCREALAVTQQR